MKLTLVSHNVIRGDGQGRVNHAIVSHALDRGIDVTLVADAVEPELVEAGARWIPIHVPLSRINLWKTWVFARRASSVVESLGSDAGLVVACGFTLNVPHDVNVVHFVHSAWKKSPVHTAKVESGPYAWYQQAYSSFNAQWEVQAFRKARHVLAVSELVKCEVRNALAAAPGGPGKIDADRPIRVIPNGVDPEEFCPAPQLHEKPLQKQDITEDPTTPLAFFAGDLRTPRKNLDTVLRAVADIPRLHLAVAGTLDGSPYPEMAKRLGIAHRVHFLGYRSDMPSLMRVSDVFVAPSRYEPFSLVVLEAMASGCPVVTASTVGAHPLVGAPGAFSEDAVGPDAGGLVISDPDDTDSLAQSLAHVLIPDVNRRMRRAARATAERHSWTSVATQYLTFFSDCYREASHLQPRLRHAHKSGVLF
jgi:glycosyltransferase involved in cell wall biosynthesis